VKPSWWVHYLSADPQGGYWEVSPRGPFSTLSAAKWAKYKLEHPISPFSGRRSTAVSDRVRNVHIRLRLEIRLPQWIQKTSVQNTHEKENRHAV
jgi:hypothetical protein